MSDFIPNVLSSAEQMKANYEKYKHKFKDSTEELVNSQTFLNLMIAEMTNQDPLEPTSNTEFVSQLAQFTQLTYMQDSSKYAMANYASSLVGKVATGSKMEGSELVTKTGLVQSVTQQGNSYNVKIDGVDFDIKKITAVKDKDAAAAENYASGALADSISRAANMVGMYVTVATGTDEKTGKDIVKTGFIDSIKVKDGKITAVIIDADETWKIEQPLENIREATVATFVFEPDPNETKENGEEDATSAEGTEEADKA